MRHAAKNSFTEHKQKLELKSSLDIRRWDYSTEICTRLSCLHYNALRTHTSVIPVFLMAHVALKE